MTIPLIGYLDRFSVRPGGKLEVKVSSTTGQPVEARLVRIRCADPNPVGPGMKIIDLGHVFKTTFPSRVQTVTLGSFARVPHHGALDAGQRAFTWTALVQPSVGCITAAVLAKGDARQLGFCLGVSPQGVFAEVANAEGATTPVSTGRALRTGIWYRIWMSCDPATGEIIVGQAPLEAAPMFDAVATVRIVSTVALRPQSKQDLLIAAREDGKQRTAHFDGRIEEPALINGFAASTQEVEIALAFDPIARWDFSIGTDTLRVHDTGPHRLAGSLINMPARGMRGAHWSGREMCWRHAPQDYAAIVFHSDDIDDCNWQTDCVFTAPDDLKSSIYGLQLTSGTVKDTIPFYVPPKRGQPQAKVAFLASTFTYQAYANHKRGNFDAAFQARVQAWDGYAWNPDQHSDYGHSTYNRHPDNSGVAYSSRARPIMTMRPGFLTFNDARGSGLRHFPADSHLTDWLEEKGIGFDVVIDEDLDDEGAELLKPYKVVITGSHPEYHTARTLDAIDRYKANGGRLMYMGGNGFYWRIARNPTIPHLIEVRRAEGGIRSWAAEPGEYYHSLDGQYGGLWRRNLRAPQKTGGVGFSAQGLFEGSHYRRTPVSRDSKYAWMFAGITSEILGNYGLSGGGAAGFELDRADAALGTPPNVAILAKSEQHQSHFVVVPEELLSHVQTVNGERPADLIRAEIVHYDLAGGGAVFAVGSITFCGSLSHNQYDNDISRLIENVVRHFMRD